MLGGCSTTLILYHHLPRCATCGGLQSGLATGWVGRGRGRNSLLTALHKVGKKIIHIVVFSKPSSRNITISLGLFFLPFFCPKPSLFPTATQKEELDTQQ